LTWSHSEAHIMPQIDEYQQHFLIGLQQTFATTARVPSG
jgi:hypothetical protein